MTIDPKIVTLVVPSETWRDEPLDHTIEYHSILGWAVKRNNGNCSEFISEEDALRTIEYWKWLFAAEPAAPAPEPPPTDPDSWIEQLNLSLT